jgi:hypothetical protein
MRKGNGDMSATSEKLVRRRVAGATAAAGLSVLLSLMGPGTAAAQEPPSVPVDVAVPAGHVLSAVGHARGVQLYECRSTANGYAWVLEKPLAHLEDDDGRYMARHYGGPTWTAVDQSSVVATRAGIAPAPSGGAIPWLLLRVTEHSGPADGLFGQTAYIQRLNTTGGLAPTHGCDAGHAGARKAVAYTADYFFYRAA